MRLGFTRQRLFVGGVVAAYCTVALFIASCSQGSKRLDAGNSSGGGAIASPDSGASGRDASSSGGPSVDASCAALDAAASTDAQADGAAAAADAAPEAGPGDVPAATLKGHWVSLGAPQAPLIGAFAFGEDGTLFAGTTAPSGGLATGGMFSTTDGGDAWHFTSKGLTSSDTSSIAATGANLFAAIGYALFRSQDHGVSWQKTNATARVVAAQGNLVVVADPYYSVSTDGGQTFAKGPAGTGTTSDDVAIVGNVILRVTKGVLTRSSDQGNSFGPVQAPSDSAFTHVSLKCDRTKICYATAYKSGSESWLYRSADAGATWAAVGPEIYQVLAVTEEGSVYVRNTSQVTERSDDGGVTWQAWTLPLTNGSCNANLLVARGDRVFASCDSGVYRSDDRGSHWALAIGSNATGALTTAATMLLVDRTDAARSPSGDLYVGVSPVRTDKLVASTDEGKSWKPLNTASPSSCAISDQRTIICSSYGSPMRSEDQGATWTRGTMDVQKVGSLVAAGSSGIYLAGDGKSGSLCRSDDDGRSFVFVANVPYTTSFQVLKSGHLLRQGGRIGKSVDRGETWTQPTWSVRDLPVPEDAEGRLYIGSAGKLLVSSDEGDSWTPLQDMPTNASLTANAYLVRDAQGRFYLNGPAAAIDPIIYFNDPASSTWGTFPAPPSPNILQFAFDKRERLLAATTAGVFRFDSE